MSDFQSRQLLRLTLLIQLEKRAREASLQELQFIAVNETRNVVPFRQAILWRSKPAQQVVALSGLDTHDPHAPFVGWLTPLLREMEKSAGGEIKLFNAESFPNALARDWTQWLPPHVIWIPMGKGLGALVLARDEAWNEGDAGLLAILSDAYGHAWKAHLARRGLREKALGISRTKRRTIAASIAVALLAGGFVPVRLSVLAPAEIIPDQPAVIRSPLDGVVDRIHVTPNQKVAAGQTLFNLDPSKIENQLEIAKRAREVAEAELRQAQQLAVTDPKARASLPVLRGKLDQQATEAAYLAGQLERIDVRAPQDGIAVFDDPTEWLGRPVSIGERVMLVADPDKIEIEARVPVADMIDLVPGSPVKLFLNIDPEKPQDATLTYAAYQAQAGADNTMAYRVKARIAADENPLRIGLKGTAKLYGESVPLAYYILRRPIAAARQWIGL